MNWIYDPWPWYVGGPLIALVMLLLLLNDKKFGMSSNLRTICAAFGAGKSTPFIDYDWKSLSILAVGGFLVGFGARYAGGCTSGHAISGLSNLQLPSLIAVIGFFIGGIIMNHYLIRFIL